LKPLHPESAVARLRQCKALGSLSTEATDSEVSMTLLQDHLGISDHQLASRFVVQLASGLYHGFSVASQADADNAPKFGKAREQLASFYKLAVGEKQVSADFAYVQVSSMFTPSK
jgi:hypothetical protein